MGEVTLLAIEASGNGVGVAICEPGVVLARADVLTTAASSELVMRLVDDVLRWTGRSGAGVDRVAVTRGPGSFTGIRVGLATARGLGMGWKRPVVTVTAFEAAVAAVGDYPGPVLVLIDARRGQIYAQAFGPPAPGGRSAGDPMVLDPDDLGSLAPAPASLDVRPDASPLVVGSGGHRYPEAVAASTPGSTLYPGDVLDGPAVAAAVWAGLGSDSLDPLYIRPPDAKLPRPEGQG